MRSVVKVSKTIEDAINEALKELDAEKGDISTEVIEEPSKGFLGFIGAKDAKVKVTVVNGPEDIAKRFIDRLLTGMSIKAKSTIERKDSTLWICVDNISSTDMGITIGRRGNTLDAIQYLLSLAVNKIEKIILEYWLMLKGIEREEKKH